MNTKYLISVAAITILLIIGISNAYAAPAPKVDVCHIDADTGIFHLINISENALQAHIDHGDALPGDPVPGMEGYIFGPDCSLDLVDIERAALIALYNSTGGDGWMFKWDTTTDHCTWDGVACDIDGKVRQLFLYSNGLTGTIPAELGNLSNLQWLDLDHNQLSGPIPPELGNLSNLWNLDLSDNQLSGPIPAELANLSNLVVLHLEGNPALVCWETQAALTWAQGLFWYSGPHIVCPS